MPAKKNFESVTVPILNEADYRNYLEALLDGDQGPCQQTVDAMLKKEQSIRTLYEDVFQRSLYEVGNLWERGRISVADEHLATAMTESLLSRVYPRLFKMPRAGHSAVVSCIADEYHQLGGKMVADIFEMHGWNSYFLGANTPVRELLKLVEKKQPDVVALSITLHSGMSTLIDAIEALRARFQDTEIWVSGQAFHWGGKNRLFPIPNVYLLNSLVELESRITHWGKADE